MANRFVPAIKEKYPEARIVVYIDSEGKTFQKEVLEAFYGRFYDDIEVILRKKYKEFWVDCQFGVDNYYGALENVPDDIRQEMESEDVFYDLHIDSLKFLDYDFDWYRYFYFFPRPEFEKSDEEYVAFHLQSATSDGHQLEKWYCQKLVEKISAFSKCKIILMESQRHFYGWAENMPNVELVVSDIKEVGNVICNAKLLLSTDSGFRYLAYGAGVPVITFSKHCYEPHKVLKSHELRWLLFPKQCFPLNYSHSTIVNLAQKILDNKAFCLFPETLDFDREMVRRRYTINREKTIE